MAPRRSGTPLIVLLIVFIFLQPDESNVALGDKYPVQSAKSALKSPSLSARSLLQAPVPAPAPVPSSFTQAPTPSTVINGSTNGTGLLSLPQVCLFQQGFAYNQTGTGAAKPLCQFEVYNPDFLDILPANPSIQELATAPVHEAGVYYPNDNSVYMTGVLTKSPVTNTQLIKVDLSTGQVTYVLNQTANANGAILSSDGALIICMQGNTTVPAQLVRLDPVTGQQSVIADNWFGLQFNSPNDVVQGPDGSFYFTDPDYGFVQGFKNPPQTFASVYRVLPSGLVDAVAEGLIKPNGIAFSPDYSQLYVTDTGYQTGNGTNVMLPHSVYVFNVTSSGRLSNKNFFASTASYDAPYQPVIPDGIKVDTAGRVYLGTASGVQVFASDGSPLGLIRYPSVSNFAFGGPALNTLVLFNDTNIATVQLSSNVTSAGQPYAKKFLNITA